MKPKFKNILKISGYLKKQLKDTKLGGYFFASVDLIIVLLDQLERFLTVMSIHYEILVVIGLIKVKYINQSNLERKTWNHYTFLKNETSCLKVTYHPLYSMKKFVTNKSKLPQDGAQVFPYMG